METKAEEAEEIEGGKIFGEISHFSSGNFTHIDTLIGGNTTLAKKQSEKITEDEKLKALMQAYEDPFVEIFNMMQVEEDE